MCNAKRARTRADIVLDFATRMPDAALARERQMSLANAALPARVAAIVGQRAGR